MGRYPYLEKKHKPDWEAFINNIKRKGTPKRVHFWEHFLDWEMQAEINKRYNIGAKLDKNDPDYPKWEFIERQRFLGYDYVWVETVGMWLEVNRLETEDTAALPHEGGRMFMNEHAGPITNWEQFEKYQWPDPNGPEVTKDIEWYNKNLPDDMCMSVQTGHFDEYLVWLMGYETLCYALSTRGTW